MHNDSKEGIVGIVASSGLVLRNIAWLALLLRDVASFGLLSRDFASFGLFFGVISHRLTCFLA